MRHSLLARLLAASVLVAVAAVAATAWLAARTTSGAIRQEQGVVLTDGTRVYSALLDFAATHPDWSGVGPLVRSLAAETGRRVVLVTQDRSPIADSAAGGAPLPATASAVVDPLAVDAALVPDAPADRIAPAAVGPFRLTAAERRRLHAGAERVLRCARSAGERGAIAADPGGRPRVVGASPQVLARCGAGALGAATPTERTALDALQGLVNGCLGRQGLPPVHLALDLTWTQAGTSPAPAVPADRVRTCLDGARHEQLAPFVAPAALLFVTTGTGEAPNAFDLSPANQVRIAVVASGVLVLAVAVTVLVGRRLVRPLHALTDAAQRMAGGELDARVAVHGRDEVARLGSAFNDMAAARQRTEALRKVMVGDVAHELRTPLSNIRGWLEAAEDGVSDRDPALITSLLEEALLLQRVIDDLQDLAMADAGQLALHPEAVRLADLLDQVATAPVEVSAPADLELVADPVRLRQVVGNLVANAVRHTPEGGSITVRARQDGAEVVIEVADTGSGIDPEDLPHVFDRFWRAEKSRNRETGGSGLGLAIARKLAEAQGGGVTATSTPGVGSTFTVRLPAGS
ncbi:sensor histidine kinase [Saccharopolyspora cebuensis]|uniref:histidine kinase n=1 Tax=Saccharopolyspora cebuensis TaxID=418759 RepID=A0ABV4CF09_9PSEU